MADSLIRSPEEMFALLEELNNTPEGPDRTALRERIDAELAAREAAGMGIPVDPIEAIRFGSNPAPNPMDNLMDFFAASESFFSNISRDPADIMASGGWQPGMTWRDVPLERWEPLLASIENPELQEYMRRIAGHFATGLSLPSMVMEPGPGELGLAAKELLPMVAMLPRLPIGLQKLVGRFLPPELVDDMGTPLRMFHMGNLPPGANDTVPLAITNSEGHGHWGFFGTPMIENTLEYEGLRSGASELYEFVAAPENPLRSTRFPGNSFNDTLRFRVTPAQEAQLTEVIESLRPLARELDLRDPELGNYWQSMLSETLQTFRDDIAMGSAHDIGDYYRRLNLWTRQMARVDPDLMKDYRFATVLSDYIPNTPSPFGNFGGRQAPDLSFTDLALRGGYDAGMGPWAARQNVNFQVNPNVAAVPSEVASYVPGANVIYPVNETNVIRFLRSKGISDDEISAALRTQSPEGSGLSMLGNVRYDLADVERMIDNVLWNEFGMRVGDPLIQRSAMRQGMLENAKWADAIDAPTRFYGQTHGALSHLPGDEPSRFVEDLLNWIGSR